MALRRPVYLDAETLMALADYHELNVPSLVQVVEKAVKKRSANAKATFTGVLSAGADIGKDVELQTSYAIEPREKATVSRAIDGLIQGNHVVEATPDAVLQKDDVVEVDGELLVTGASLAGKMFYVLGRCLETTQQDLESLDFSKSDADVMKMVHAVYFQKELVPVPLLVEVKNSGLAPRVFVSLRPSFFVDTATANQVEGERRVLGTVRNLIAGDGDGYLSTEEWLLPDWEYLTKRLIMTKINDKVEQLVAALKIDLPAGDVQAWIEGPAVVLDAVAVY